MLRSGIRKKGENVILCNENCFECIFEDCIATPREEVEKKRAYNAKYYQNEEKRKAYKAEYYQNNKEKIRAYNAEYYQNNKEKRKAYQAEYRRKKKEGGV